MNSALIIGLMSGSSLDGIDLAAVSFNGDNDGNVENWTFLCGKTSSFEQSTKKRLIDAPESSGKELWQLHADMGHLFGREVAAFIKENNLNPTLVASHGHTIFHHPESHMTCQIGDGAAIAIESGIPVISDFRSTDIALGGQGAPLAPLADQLLFPDYEYFLNLGGIANLSTTNKNQNLAYDICACNQLLNFYAATLDLPYDDEGRVASRGKFQPDVMSFLNNWNYYRAEPPKSLDNEQVRKLIQHLDNSFNFSAKDMLHTAVNHMGEKIGQAFNMMIDDHPKKIMTSGGGAFNSYLISRINSNLNEQFSIEIPSIEVIEYKEAMLMALAGWRRLNKQSIFFHSLTGANRDCSGGAYYLPT